jgi:GNAT superfamily N-acetyltransferase
MMEGMRHCKINGSVTDERYRGKGIGKLLIERVRQAAKDNGNDVLCLHCNLTRTTALLLYEHIGF